MPAISVCTENQFYNLGMTCLINDVKKKRDNYFGKQVDATTEQDKIISFHKGVAVIDYKEKKSEHPPFPIIIIFCTKNLLLSEIKTLLSYILKIAQRSRREFIHLNKMKAILPTELEQLTFHEMKIIKLLAKGNSISTISQIMNCKKSTTYTHRRNILRKTRTVNRQRLNKIIQVLKNYDTKYSDIILL
ncbi:helix-turn-helix transcriptional regulator [Rosenbergiella metrosideri]|uniref:helix-turn-helix transcriptional regulator n=1 Tax=Rosenbergiella metrosideri TaxID=2921185 RepID=UPI001F4FACDB|nr:LuxR C-terminal-related transcriptional regulator [Rosenbergiella metrosideri]